MIRPGVAVASAPAVARWHAGTTAAYAAGARGVQKAGPTADHPGNMPCCPGSRGPQTTLVLLQLLGGR
jgi:hypothetical protein